MFFLGDNEADESDMTFFGDPIDWNAIINQGFGIGSQLIGAYGKRPTNQIAYNANTDSIFAIGGAGSYGLPSGYPQGFTGNTVTGQPYAQPYVGQPVGYNPSQGVGAGVGAGVGSGVDAAINWASRNPLIVAGGALALFLLFREPPRRR